MGARVLMPWTLSVVAIAAAAIMHLALRFEVIRLGYELSSLRSEQRQLIEAHRNLSLESATLQQVSRVDRLARQQLGMRKPLPSQVFRLRHQETDDHYAVQGSLP